jgi:CBS domain containing-hemolysin-like protein
VIGVKVWVYKGDTWVATICQPWKPHVRKKSVAHVAHAVMAAQVATVQVLAVVVHVVPWAPTAPLPMAATSPPVPVAPTQPPLSAFVKLTRPLQQRTAKENKDAATCSPQIPQGAKGP